MQFSLYINNRNVCLQLFEPFLTLLLRQSRELLKKAVGVTMNSSLLRETLFYSFIFTKLVSTLISITNTSDGKCIPFYAVKNLQN